MTVDSKFEELYRQIELTRGAGNRGKAQLCVMSFVAFLAGEDHSDNPATASPLIRRFAMTVNDDMSPELRQTLKSFAPLIIGTRDGHDRARTDLLLTMARTELIPRIEAELTRATQARPPHDPRRNSKIWSDIYQHVRTLTSVQALEDSKTQDDIALAIARLICCCGHTARLPEQRTWYWAKAIDVLDRLCTIGAEDERPAIPTEQLDAMSAFLMNRHHRLAQRNHGSTAWTRIWELIPAMVR